MVGPYWIHDASVVGSWWVHGVIVVGPWWVGDASVVGPWSFHRFVVCPRCFRASVVCLWYLHGAFTVSLWWIHHFRSMMPPLCLGGVHGQSMMLPSCVRGGSMVDRWRVHGASVVCLRCLRRTIVGPWCFHDGSMCFRGVFMARL